MQSQIDQEMEIFTSNNGWDSSQDDYDLDAEHDDFSPWLDDDLG
jgi:hypothetical protein